MCHVDENLPNPDWSPERAEVLREAGAGNRFVLSLAAIHEDARSGLPALQAEALRWRELRGSPRSEVEQTPVTFWAYVQPSEQTQRACRFLLRQGRYLIGRAESSDLRFDCPGVSRRHAEIIVLSTRGVLVRDLGSVNGTRVDGALITEAAVDGEAILDLGPVRLNLAPDDRP